MQIPLRDIRVMDPMLSHYFPSSLAVRDHALIVNLPPIICVASASECLVLDHAQPSPAAFVVSLCEKLQRTIKIDVGDKSQDASDAMPFELMVLEEAFKAVVRHYDSLLSEMDGTARTVMQKLLEMVSFSQLESVGHLRARMSAVQRSIDNFASVLEKHLENRDALIYMYLSRQSILERQIAFFLEEFQEIEVGGAGIGTTGSPRATSIPRPLSGEEVMRRSCQGREVTNSRGLCCRTLWDHQDRIFWSCHADCASIHRCVRLSFYVQRAVRFRYHRRRPRRRARCGRRRL